MKLPVLFMLGAMCATPPAWAGDASGQAIAFACAGCHGIKELGLGSVPILRIKEAAAMENSLLEFKSGSKTGTIMPRIAKGLSDTEIKAVAEYYGNLKKQRQ